MMFAGPSSRVTATSKILVDPIAATEVPSCNPQSISLAGLYLVTR